MPILNSRGEELLTSVERSLALSGVSVEWNTRTPGRPHGVDGFATLRLDEMPVQLPFKLRTQLRPSTVRLLPPELPPGTLIVSDQVTGTVGELLRRQHLNYADTAGNAFVSAPGVRIYLAGLRSAPSKPPSPALFTNATNPVILAILNRPVLIHAPVRELQARTNASLGTVHRVQRQLRTSGLEATPREDQSVGNRRRWRHLFEGWVAAYTAMRDGILLGRYTSSMPIEQLPAVTSLTSATLSGELAALMTGSGIRPATADLYVDETAAPLIQAARLRPSPNGPIAVRQAIWTSKMLEDSLRSVPKLAPSPIIYADIASILDPRTDVLARDWIDHDPNLRSLLRD